MIDNLLRASPEPEIVTKPLFSTYYVLPDTSMLQMRQIALVKLK